jgi:hypothetical protein
VKVVGVNGYARTGKDTVAAILVEQYGFQRLAFADKLREAAYELNPIVFMDQGWQSGAVYLQDVIDEYGWDGYKETLHGPEIRRILQRMGTEVGRNILGENIWVLAVLNNLENNGKYVFTDCRFENEAEAVTNLWGQVWRIDRPGVGPANDHISEIGLDDWNFDVRINNAGSIEDLAEKVAHHARGI